MRVVIAGCGDLGSRVAARLAGRGDAVLALRRQPRPLLAGVETRVADLRCLGAGELAAWRADAAIFAAAPDLRTPEAYQQLYVEAAARLPAALGGRLRRLLFVSSTAVYGDAGDWVDEGSPCTPSRWNGERLLAAEAALAAAFPGRVAVRASGLYGPGREAMLRRARDGECGDGRWTNRIHIDDAAAALIHLLDLDVVAPVYCLSDDRPEQAYRVLAWLRAAMGQTLPAPTPLPAAGRRVDNRLLRASGWRPLYPDYRAGYSALLQALGELRV